MMTPQATIVCLFGTKGAGKDTVADYLLQLHPNACKLGFADLLKQVVGTAFEFDASKMDEFDYKEQTLDSDGISCRQRLTEVGELFREQYGRAFWSNKLFQRIDAQLAQMPPNALILVKDARFEEEWEALKAYYATRETIQVCSIKITRYYYPQDALFLLGQSPLPTEMVAKMLLEQHRLEFDPAQAAYRQLGVAEKAEQAIHQVKTDAELLNFFGEKERLYASVEAFWSKLR
jgi:hypothetical protein